VVGFIGQCRCKINQQDDTLVIKSTIWHVSGNI
jgi:hypothetical protein